MAAVLAVLAGALWAEAVDPLKLAQVKAAYVANFIRYTEWPAGTFATEDAPYVVCVLGAKPVAEALEAIAHDGGAIAGRGLAVHRLRRPGPELEAGSAAPGDLCPGQVLYVGDDAGQELSSVLATLGQANILTIGDGTGFAAAGGMIGLVRDGPRVVFEANPAAIQRTKLLVSARVLQLARIVGDEAPP